MDVAGGVDSRLVTDVLKLVQSFDLKKIMGSVQGGDGSLDTMVSALTRSMLSEMPAAGPSDSSIVHTVSLSLHQAQLGKRKKVRIRRTKAGVREQRETVVEIPAGCPDGHEIRVAGEGNEGEAGEFGDLVVRVSVADVGGAFYTDKVALYTRVALTLSETRRLSLRLKLPGGREVVLAHDDDAPLSGWRALRGEGLRYADGRDPGDVFVHFEVALPASWSAVAALADVAARHEVAPAAASGELSLLSPAELASCARALQNVPLSP